MSRFKKANPSELPCLSFDQCFAKTTPDNKGGMSVFEHCHIVGRVAEAILQKLPSQVKSMIGNHSSLCAALHDVGKVSPGFQKKYFNAHIEKICPDLSAIKGGFEENHAAISEAAINAYMNADYKTLTFASIAGIHHGRRSDKTPFNDTGELYGGRLWASERKKLIEKLIEIFGPFPDATEDIRSDILAGLVCVSDWIGSDETFFPAEGLPENLSLTDQAKHAVETCGWHLPKIVPNLSFKDLFFPDEGYEPYPLQRDFIKCVDQPGLYILEAPMGTGKTEAALYAAYTLMAKNYHHGIFFGLPTRLTSDKIHDRIQPFIERICQSKEHVTLAHGSAWLKHFEYGGEAFASGNDWFYPRKRALLTPFAVGTIDQALMSVLRVKHFFVRTFGLAGKVVILDEVHSYDSYTGTLLDRFVHSLLGNGCTVIILSATLTSEKRNAFFAQREQITIREEYPLISCQTSNNEILFRTPEYSVTRQVQLEITVLNDQNIADKAVNAALNGSCVILIANTVAKAQSWYSGIKSAMPEGAFPVGLLHSKFPMFQRAEIESEWMKRLGKKGDRSIGCILVATQIVEQSIDIDGDLMISELAPMDMVFQRMGRLWRHDIKNRPVSSPRFILISNDLSSYENHEALIDAMGKSNTFVYAPYVLFRTFSVLKDLKAICLPEDIRSLLEKTYAPEDEKSEMIKALYRKLEAKREKLVNSAFSAFASVEDLPVFDDNEYVATRYESYPTINIIIAKEMDQTGIKAELTLLDGYKLSLHRDERNFYATRRLHLNVITVPEFLFSGHYSPAYLARHFHQSDTTLVLKRMEDGVLLLDGNPTPLKYDATCGLQRISKNEDRQKWHDNQVFSTDDTEETEDFVNEFNW